MNNLIATKINFIVNVILSNLYTISLYTRKIAAAAVVFILARYLSLYDYGLYSSYVNIATFCLLIANLGYNEYILVSTNKNIKKIQLEIVFFLAFAIFMIFVFIVLATTMQIEQYIIFCLILFKVFFDTVFFNLILPYFQAQKAFQEIGKLNILYSIYIIILVFISYIMKISLLKFLSIYVLVGLHNFLLCSKAAHLRYHYIFTKIKTFFQLIDKSIIYYISVSLIVFIKSQLSSLFVSFVLPKEDAAIYFAAFNVVSILSLISIAQIQQLFPELISKNYKHIINVIKYNCIFITVLNVSILFIFILFGQNILFFIYHSKEYINAYYYLLVLTLCTLINALAMILASYMSAQNYQKEKSKLQLEFLIFVCFVMFIFHKLGVWGAVCTTLCLEIYTFIRYFTFFIKDIRRKNKENDL